MKYLDLNGLSHFFDKLLGKVASLLNSKVDKVSGKGLSTNDYTTDEKDKLGTIAKHAEVNQNAFSNVIVGSTTIAADAKTDSLTIAAGTGISVSGDATNDKVTITNSGVRSVSTGGTNGTISVNVNGSSSNVAVKGLGSAAYTESSAYDPYGIADTKASAALASAKEYADGVSTTKADSALESAKQYANGVKNDLLNGAGAAYDTLKELGELIDVNTDAIDALEKVAAGKANANHSHTITANASDDDVVVLTGTNGTNTVTYNATHATSGVSAGTYKSITVNKYGHITSGSNPTTLSGYGITDAASKTHTHNYAGSSSAGGAATKAIADQNGYAFDRAYGSLIPFGTEITANIDLNTNTFLKVGNYYCAKHDTAKTLSNCPAVVAFMMQVYSPLSSTIDNESTKTWCYRLRKLITYDGDEYIQKVNSQGTAGTFVFDAWKKVIKSNNIATTSAAGLMSAADKTKLNSMPTSIVATDDGSGNVTITIG